MFQRSLQWVVSAAWKSCGALFVLAALAVPAFGVDPPGVPEIDPLSVGNALTLLTGGLLMLTARRRRS